ncbi:hypothetical protein H7Y40_01915, partial [Pedobacter sp.]|nr:hypothetical protein [Candidatus Saccharibacteria bacterium]
MAVVRLADYYAKHLRRVYYVSAAMLIAINAAFITLLIVFRVDLLFAGILVILPVVFLQVFAVIIILRYAMEPLEILSRAITHTSTQANDVKPPILNEPRFEKTGLKTMVQTVYNSAANNPSEASLVPSAGALSPELMDQFPCGIIVLDESKNVVYSNALAPIFTDPQGVKQIELIFKDEDTLSQWLTDSENSKVSDQHIWSRVQNRLPDSTGRQLFDVVGHYQKGGAGGYDTVLITIDRTGHYSVDEEDMDFIALAAHELRGPITVIRGYLDVLIEELTPVLEGDQRELLDRLSVSASRLSGYVSNIMNVSRYDRRHLKLYL